MLKQLASLTLAGAAALPAGAQWVCVPQRPVCLPPVVYVVPCQPAAPATAPPRISQDAPLHAPRPMPKDPAPDAAVRPTAGMAVPTPAVPPPQPEAPRPAPRISLDPVPAPSAPPATPKSEPLQLPPPSPTAEPKAAVPGEAEGVKIPPLIPRLPGTDASLPPLSLPPVPNESTSRSSPLGAKPQTAAVEVFPVDGPPPASPAMRRAIGFFNHTDRDLRLTVEGETITLPRRHQVTATAPAKFRWRIDGGPERTTEVPATSPGVEVVFRK